MEELLAEERQQDSGMVDHTDVARKSSASSLSPLNAKAAIVGLAAAMTVEEEGGQMEAATSKRTCRRDCVPPQSTIQSIDRSTD